MVDEGRFCKKSQEIKIKTQCRTFPTDSLVRENIKKVFYDFICNVQ
jgi:hypothetical protein